MSTFSPPADECPDQDDNDDNDGIVELAEFCAGTALPHCWHDDDVQRCKRCRENRDDHRAVTSIWW